jgi:hypothetical protein
MKLFRSFTLALFIYSLLGWVYVVLIDLVHNKTLPLPLSHLTTWIRLDTFGIICFIVSFISFFLWRFTEPKTKD